MSFSVKYNRTTNHIAGIAAKTESNGNENGGVVAYYAENACGVITSGRLAQGKSSDDLAEILTSARLAGGRKLCSKCEKAATAALAS